MIRLAGNITLITALIISLIQGIAPLWGYYRHNAYLLAVARTAAFTQCLLVISAFSFLTFAFVTGDFSISYVAENSHTALPLMYRLTATWGAHEGSMLLWIVLLNMWTIAYATLENNASSPMVLAILGILSFSFLCFLLLTSNPFLPTLTAFAGRDLNPLLQDPGFVIHPPMLYTGYVGFSVAFAITLAALLRGKLDTAWATITRRFATAAWCFLTIGIALGSWWAYRVLGWGGFWFWDPVENASLLPWLAGTALIHVLVLAEKRNIAQNWAALLALVCFALSLLGTFLVRSGMLVSAHTFANDPARGIFLLLLLAILLTASLAIYIIRIPQIATHTHAPYSPWSREMALLLNSGLLIMAMLTVLLGTLYPLILDALHLGTISVGAPYFNTVMTPLVLIIMAVMSIAAMCRWQDQTAKQLWQASWKRSAISLAIASILTWYYLGHIDLVPLLGLSLSFWIVASIIDSLRITPGMAYAHLGFAILVIGLMLSSYLSQEREVRIKPGDMTHLGPYQFLFLDVEGLSGPNYRGIRAAFDVTKGMHHVTNLYPEKRIYTVRAMIMTKVDIHPGIFRDLYIALGEPLNQDYWSVRIYYKPFIRWIWLGAIIMTIGGIAAILQRRQRPPSHRKLS